MNGMNFKPFISKLLGSLSDNDLIGFNGLIDSHSDDFTNRSLINANNLLTVSDKGIGLFTIQLDQNTVRSGYLVYNDTYCVLLAYVSNSERVMEYEIDMSKKTYNVVKEFLTTDYLRHEVAIRANGASDTEAIVVSNIKNLTNKQINALKAGDVVIKKTGKQRHTYRVSYKDNEEGICLTYSDASVIETVSYDLVDGNWVYNSTDVTHIGLEAIEDGIEKSLLNGELKDVLQAKTLSVADFPLESDIDNQHATVNEGLLPNGDMSDLTETQISKLVLTLNRIINKGWLKVNTGRAVKLTNVMYDATVISITASTIVFGATGILSGKSYLITLDIANTSYSYAENSYAAA